MQLIKKQHNTIKIMTEALGAVVVLICIICSVRMNIVGRTLWLDEAMLAMSFCKRSFSQLFVAPLDWNQSAPVGYIFIVRIITAIFGTTEAALRSFSVIAYALMLLVFYLIAKEYLKTEYPFLCTAAVANIKFLLKYSNMFKPYIFDTLCVLVVILIYHFYLSKKLSFWQMAVCYAILIWCSNPVAFISGGVLATEFLCGLIKKDKSRVIHSLITGAAVLISFGLLYLFWLKPTIGGTNLQEFWEGEEFPLLLKSISDIKRFYECVKFVCSGIGAAWQIIVVLAIAGMILNFFIWRDEVIASMAFSALLTLFASNMGYFPVSDRLFTFCIPMLVLAAFFTIKKLTMALFAKREECVAQAISLLLIFCFLLSGTGIEKYHTGEAYIKGEESKDALLYLKDNLKEDDQIYVYYAAIPIFSYEMGYDTDSVCGYDHNVRFGTGFFYEEDNMATDDIDWILSQDRTYLFFTHVVKYQPIKPLLKILKKEGALTEVMPPYLYIYERK